MPLPIALPHLAVHWSPNYSSRLGQPVRGIVLHETEGSYQSAISWFAESASQVSAHFVIREDGGEITQCVRLSEKAWHACNVNPYTIGIELAGEAARPLQGEQLKVAAHLAAYLCRHFGIIPHWAFHAWNGLATHRQLGAFGCNHSDPDSRNWSDTWFINAVAETVHGGGWIFPSGYGIW